MGDGYEADYSRYERHEKKNVYSFEGRMRGPRAQYVSLYTTTVPIKRTGKMGGTTYYLPLYTTVNFLLNTPVGSYFLLICSNRW